MGRHIKPQIRKGNGGALTQLTPPSSALGAPNLNFEFYDGSAWYTLATQSYVNSSVFNINTNTSEQLAISRLNGYPNSTSTFLRGDGSWGYVNLSSNVTGQLSPGLISGYPYMSGAVLHGDGTGWHLVNLGYTIGSLAISQLSSYPFNSGTILHGDGTWRAVNLSSDVSGSLLPWMISGYPYPSNPNVFLNGQGGWTTPYINSLLINGDLSLGTYTLSSGAISVTGGITTTSDINCSGNIYSMSLSTSFLSCINSANFNGQALSGVGSLANASTGKISLLNNLATNGNWIMGDRPTNNVFFSSNGVWYCYSPGSSSQYFQYGYLNSGGNTGSASGYNYYSLVCNYRVAATEFNATSSLKIKKILASGQEIEGEALDLFKKISFSKYVYKDTVNHGGAVSFGVIAEEIEKILPGYTSNHDAFVPNVLKTASVRLISKGIYELNFTDDLEDIEGTLLKIFTTDKEVTGTIISVTPQKIQLQCDEALPLEVFVYGAKENCPSVTKNKLFELSMVVLKNVLARLEKLEA